MNTTGRLHSASYLAIILNILFFLSGMAYADSCTDWVAKLDSFQGKVQAKRTSGVEWKQVLSKDSFCAGDMLRVMEKSRAIIVLKNETVMRLDQNTTITLAAPTQQKPSLLDLIRGAAYFISRTPQKFRVNTPFLNAGIEGTEFLVSVGDRDAMVSVFEGIVLAENNAGAVTLTQGQTASAAEGRTPVLNITIRPKDAVQWTLYYPQVISLKQDGISADWQNQVSSLLSVGRVDEANIELEKALGQEPSNSAALSLQAVIAVAQNEKDKALEYARRAVASAPNSGSAHIALSYALQARFDLAGAVQSVKTAVQREPNNALAWARLSELNLSLGDRKESLAAAEKAAGLAPDLSRTQTVLGFAHLSQIRTNEAMTAFEKAAGLDPADPLPRLGLGLAKIRKGQLEDGRREIEIAVSLDTGNALIRSYLGKAYHEEKRDSVASDQFIMAEAADPKDPTAFFYSALQKQTQNRPVEALQDLEKSMALNDNRAVYRSRLLLDEDQAARGASLARIYDDLGFQQLALSEGYKSVNADPANASAHRFLSDSYAALPRHEIARVSELLQAQLLQPVGLNPVQPHLADPGSFILQGSGPADAGFNEYNSLFNRSRFSLLMSGVVGSHNTFGDEMVVSGLHDRLSLSVGQFHYETDGFRKNNDVRQDIYNVFVQYSVSSRTSVQAEFRKEIKSYGDLALRFFQDNFSETLRNKDEMTSARIGLHHSLGPGSDLIANIGYQKSKFTYHEIFPPVISSFDLDVVDDHSLSSEVQYLLKREKFDLIAGLGYFSIDRNVTSKYVFVAPPESVKDTMDNKISHENVYLYSKINFHKDFIFTLGLSADLLKGANFDKDQLNPKFGLIWSPLPDTTIRAAIFRTLERTLTSSQTIEPIQVAGFSQFFDDGEGTDAWTYGIGIDQKLSKNVSAGLEYSHRQLDLPVKVISSGGSPVIKVADWKERFGRAYLYWTPHKWIALSAEYLYERFDRDPASFPEVEHLDTHRFPLAINFYHPSGITAKAKATYITQEGKFSPLTSPFAVSDQSNFWLFDASIGYRLPKRIGMISIVGKNLFDKSFKYQDIDPKSPIIQPGRSVFFKLTLAL
ncbi:MAG: TonB-dependent receptor [Nitrospirae bacterium]|nr:TonB-dependent receptor [Nitrospirota bacterium]